MSMVGANYEALEAGAAQMRRAADELDAHAKSIQGTIGGLSWFGQVASAFLSLWNGGHRVHLNTTANFIRDAATKLETQARQQRYASETGAEGWIRDTLSPAILGRPPEQAAPPTTPGGNADSGVPPTPSTQAPPIQPPSQPTQTGAVVGAALGELPNSHRSWQDAKAAYDEKYHTYGLYRDGYPGAENQYQCVSWAWFRMRELGYQGAQFSADGGQVAAGLGGTTDTIPKLGAVVSSSGHVMVVEEVKHLPDGRVAMRVSEMNTNSDPYTASADEYRSDRWIEQTGNGQWSYYGKPRTLTIANPSY